MRGFLAVEEEKSYSVARDDGDLRLLYKQIKGASASTQDLGIPSHHLSVPVSVSLISYLKPSRHIVSTWTCSKKLIGISGGPTSGYRASSVRHISNACTVRTQANDRHSAARASPSRTLELADRK